jgi:hypothetical protein
MCQNIQCITNKINDLNLFLSGTNIDIIVISEHWLTPENYHLYSLEGYNMCAKYIRQNHIHGGVAIFVKENIKIIERLDIQSLTAEFVVEFCAIEIIESNLLIIAIYRTDRSVETFFSHMQDMLNLISKHSSNKMIIIAGDINIDITEDTKIARRFTSLLKSFGLHCLIQEPTRETKNASSCLDQFIVTHNVNMTTLVKKHHFSDHDTLLGQISLQRDLCTNVVCNKIRKRLFNTNNKENFRTHLKQINWNTALVQGNNVNTNYEHFSNQIKTLLDTHIPLTQIVLKNRRNTTWISKGLKKCCYHKRILRYLSTYYSNDILKVHAKKYSKILKKIINTEKRKSYIQRLKIASNKYKEMWKIINEKTNPLKSKKVENICLNYENKQITSPTKVAEIFNNFFINIGLNKNCVTSNKVSKMSLPNSLFLSDITEREVRNTILSLKRNNSCGHDEIPATLLVHCVDEFVGPLTILINQSCQEGIFPDSLKLSIIKPIFKKGNKHNVSNYRPIALLSVISKIFEKIVCNKIYDFFEKYHIFSENQHGFRKNRSTTSAVFECNVDILNALNRNQCVIALFMDMSKAYDRVVHGILLEKLYSLGIRGNMHNWLASYLSDRKQCVQIGYLDEKNRQIRQITSAIESTSGSIPQGSVLGCLLFLAYINELPSVVKHRITLFADDATLLVTCDPKNIANLQNEISNCLQKIIIYLNSLNLTLNFDKTKLMQLRPYQRARLSVQVSYQGQKIEEVDAFSLLGITMDTNFSWKQHVEVVGNKLSSFSYALRELRKATNEECALAAYHGHAAAWIRYGIIFWGNSTDVNAVSVLQKRCVRIITMTAPRDSCRTLFTKYKILTVTCVYILELCRFVRKNMKYFERIGDKTRRFVSRRENDLVLPTPKLEIYKNGPYYMAIKIYNHLPNMFKALQNSRFENELKKILIQKSYYNVKEYFYDKLQCDNYQNNINSY